MMMIKGARLAALATALLATACLSDRASAPPTAPDDGSGHVRRQSSSASEAVPVSVSILPTVIVGGGPGSSTAKVSVESAVSFDRVVQISSNHPEIMPFLSTGTTIPAFSTFGSVSLLPSTVSAETIVTIFATGGGVTVSADLTVEPPGTPPPAPTIASYTVSPSTVNAGTTATGTITIPSPAPAGGVVVMLFTRIPASATVPPSVTVPAGATSASFPIATFAGFPNSTTSVLLTAQNGNTVVASSITVVTGSTTTTTTEPTGTVSLAAPTLVSPAADSRFAPGANITFDWSDVTGAASYTIQIDDKDTFPSPLVMTQTVTTSRLSTATLPTATMWWRVRANSSSGTAGAWSNVRRFEVKR